MAIISQIKLPSGNTYEIADSYARQLLAGGLQFVICWDGTSTPTVGNIPEGVVVTYNGTNYTGTMAASSAESMTFYLVKSSTQVGVNDHYDEYAAIEVGASKAWEKIGDTNLDLSNLGALAYKDNVTLNKGDGDNVLGEATTFTTSVTPTTTNIKATASGTAVGANGTAAAITGFGAHTTENFVKSVTADTTKKLVTTAIPNVTGNTSVTANKSTWSFTIGSSNDATTLIIGGGNGSDVSASKVTLGTAITAATGAATTSGTGAAIVTDVTIGESAAAITALGTPTTSNCLTGVKVTSQPTVSLATGATAGTGVISVATGITSATTTAGTNDKVNVAKYGELSVSVS